MQKTSTLVSTILKTTKNEELNDKWILGLFKNDKWKIIEIPNKSHIVVTKT